MHLTVLIPAYNEVESIGSVLAGVPRTLPGIVSIRIVVIDDGSMDGTGPLAQTLGATVLRHQDRLGLAAAFRTGLAYALAHRTDLIATIDGDGQYNPAELASLLSTMQQQKADLVVGDRQISRIDHMPLGNKVGNIVGSAMLRWFGTTHVTDASSGFRLFTASLGLWLRITSMHTYTHEMLIQASAFGFRVVDVPVTFLQRRHGTSKLIRSLRHHLFRSCGTIVKSLFFFRPLKKCLCLAGVLVVVGIVAMVRMHSFIGAMIFLILAVQFVIVGVVAESMAAERRVAIERLRITAS